MSSEIQFKEILNALDKLREEQADWRSKIPSLVLIYPLDQNYLKSDFVGQKWMLKLCCMAPGDEHTLQGRDDTNENETNPALGWYRLDDLGVLTGPVIKWVNSKKGIIKAISPRLGAILEWIHKDGVTEFLKKQGEAVGGLNVPESSLPQGGDEYLPVASEWIGLAGLDESDYRTLEGQGPLFLKSVFEKTQYCGNLFPYSHQNRILWLCKEHYDKMKPVKAADHTLLSFELLNTYRQHLEKQISKVRVLGESTEHNLTKVFVELTVIEEREWPSSQTQAEYWGMMDSELYTRRNPFAHDDDQYPDNHTDEVKIERSVKPDELLRVNNRIVIVGAPGSGKSTLLRYLAYKTLQQAERLPVFLEFKRITEPVFDKVEGRLEELVFEKAIVEPLRLNREDRENMRQMFLNKLKAGQVSIFLDGLDEVSGTEFFPKLRFAVTDFIHSAYRHNTFIISTRPYALRDRFSRDDIQEMEIAPFNQSQIEQFIDHYYGGDSQVKKFTAELRNRRELRELASSPALLGFLLRLYREQGMVSDSRLELYRRMVHQLVSEWDAEKGARREFRIRSDARRLDFLCYLAFTNLFSDLEQEVSKRLIFTGQQIMNKSEVYCQLKKLAINSDDLAEDVKFTPLLREVGEDAYAFSHLTIQEYLAAVQLSEREDLEQVFCHSYFDPTLAGMEVLPMALGLASKSESIYTALEQLPESLLLTNLRLRVRGIAYGAKIGSASQQIIVDRLFDLIYERHVDEDPYRGVILQAFSAAAGRAFNDTVVVLTPLLLDENPHLRRNVAFALGYIGGESAVTALNDALKDEHITVRKSAAFSLGQIGGEMAARALAEALKDKDRNVRMNVISALRQIGGGQAVVALCETLKDEDSSVRAKAAFELGQVAGEQILSALGEAMKDASSNVRISAVQALRHIGGDGAFSMLADASTDGDSGVRRVVVEVLGQIGGERVIPFLCEAMRSVDENVRQSAVSALEQVGGEQAVSVLIETIKDKNDDIRSRAAEALGRLGSKEAVAALREALKDKYGRVRMSAASALERIGDEQAELALCEALENEYYDVNWRAVEALGLISGERQVPILCVALKHSDPDLRWRVAAALGNIGGEHAVAALLELQLDEDEYVRRSAIMALKLINQKRTTASRSDEPENSDIRHMKTDLSSENIDPAQTVPYLLGALSDTTSNLRRTAARALGKIDDRKLTRGLLSSLRYEMAFVRWKAASVIGYYAHDEKVCKELSRLATTDPIEEVRDIAQEALGKVSRKQLYFST